MPRRICLDCGALTTGASRCNHHEAEHRAQRATYERARGAARGSGWQRQANLATIRQRVAETGAPCIRCGTTFDDLADVTADHVIPLVDGGSNDLTNLAPAHRACNSSHGARLGNARRRR
jgi:5-methylcytosine-specific restriction endonuclease McrA